MVDPYQHLSTCDGDGGCGGWGLTGMSARGPAVLRACTLIFFFVSLFLVGSSWLIRLILVTVLV